MLNRSGVATGHDAFRAFRRIYDYDPKPLNASVDSVDDTSPYWRRERISYDAAYDERMFGYLLTPKNAQPPYGVWPRR